MLGKILVVNRHNYEGEGMYIGRGSVFGNKSSHKNYRGVEVVVGQADLQDGQVTLQPRLLVADQVGPSAPNSLNRGR